MSIKNKFRGKRFTLDKLLSLSKDIKKYPELKPDYYLRIARAYRLSDMSKKSLRYLREAFNINPKDPRILNEFGNVYKDLENYSLALEYFNKAYNLKPSKLTYKLNMAEIYGKLDKPQKARQLLKDILRKDKNNTDALTLLGIIYGRDLGKYKEAIELFNKALKQQPDDHVAQVGLARALIKTNKFKKAESILKGALRIHKKCRPSLINLGEIYEWRDKYKIALSYFLKAQKINDNEFIRAKITIINGELYFQNKNYKKAINVLYPILLKVPSFCDGYSTVGWSYYYLENINKAKYFFKKQIIKCPYCGMGEFNLGQLYFLKKQYKLAKKYFLEAKNKPRSKGLLSDIRKNLIKINKRTKTNH